MFKSIPQDVMEHAMNICNLITVAQVETGNTIPDAESRIAILKQIIGLIAPQYT